MTNTKGKVLEKLGKITYKKSLDDEKGISIDNFASFLVTKPSMPSNNELKKFFEDDVFKEHTPTQLYNHFKIKKLEFDNDFIKKNLSEPFNNKFMFVGLNVAARPNKTTNILSDWQNFHDSKYNDNNKKNTCRLYVQTNDTRFHGCYITDAIKTVVESDSNDVNKSFFLTTNVDLCFSQADYDVYHNVASELEKKLVLDKDQKRVDTYMNYTKNTGSKKNPIIVPWYKVNERKEAEKAIKDNKRIFMQSADTFFQEIKNIGPKKLLVFGQKTYHALQQMKGLDKFKKISSYANLIDDAIVLYHYSGYDTLESHFKTQPCRIPIFEEKETKDSD